MHYYGLFIRLVVKDSVVVVVVLYILQELCSSKQEPVLLVAIFTRFSRYSQGDFRPFQTLREVKILIIFEFVMAFL